MKSILRYQPVTNYSLGEPISGTVRLLPVARQHFGKVLPFMFEAAEFAGAEFAFGLIGRSETTFSAVLTSLLRDRQYGVTAHWTARDDDAFGHVTVDALREWQSVPAERNSPFTDEAALDVLPDLSPPELEFPPRPKPSARPLPPVREF